MTANFGGSVADQPTECFWVEAADQTGERLRRKLASSAASDKPGDDFGRLEHFVETGDLVVGDHLGAAELLGEDLTDVETGEQPGQRLGNFGPVESSGLCKQRAVKVDRRFTIERLVYAALVDA